MGDCCAQARTNNQDACPGCGQPGRTVDRLTLKALLRPEALTRLGSGSFRFCAATECPTVYHGLGGRFQRGDVAVPVFQKEPEGDRIVCYCFSVSERSIRQEVEDAGVSASAQRIKALVQSGSCACEVKNPQGTCCLGNVIAIARPPAVAHATEGFAGSGMQE